MDKSDPKFIAMTDWIKSLSFPRPNYGIIYTNPRRLPRNPAPSHRPPPKPRQNNPVRHAMSTATVRERRVPCSGKGP